jgi:hypothetical protein
LRDLTKREDEMGDKRFIAERDFSQIVPVIRRAKRTTIVNSIIKKSHLWNNFEIMKLTKNMRVENNIPAGDIETRTRLLQYSNYLLQIGEGSTDYVKGNTLKVPSDMCLSTSEEVIDFVYDNFQDNIDNENGTYFSSRALLTTMNETVEDINKKMLAKQFSEEEIEFLSSD